MGDRLATIDIGRKWGTVPLSFGVGALGPHVTQCGLGRGLLAYLCTNWHLDPSSRLATINMDRKVGGLCHFLGGAGSPSNNAAWAEAYVRTK